MVKKIPYYSLGKLLPHSNGVFSTSEVGHKGSWVRAQVDDKSVKGHPQTMPSQNRQLLTISPIFVVFLLHKLAISDPPATPYAPTETT